LHILCIRLNGIYPGRHVINVTKSIIIIFSIYQQIHN
jgi:hypothetical protein